MPPYNPFAFPPGIRQEIRIEARTGPDDTNGEATWQPVRSVMAVLSTASSKEFFLANRFTGEATHLVTLAWQPGLTIEPGMRVVFENRYFTIQAPPENVQERNRMLKLVCLEINSGAATA